MKKSGFEYYKRKREVAPLEEAFKDLLRAYRLERKFEEKQLTQAWQEIVGTTVASRTSALYVKEATLFAKIESGPLKKELNMAKSKVLARIQAQFGEALIKEILFY